MDEISNCDYSKESIEQYFPVVLFIMPYKVVLTFESVDKILKFDHLNKSPTAILCYGTVYYAVQCGFKSQSVPNQMKAIEHHFRTVLFFFSQLETEI